MSKTHERSIKTNSLNKLTGGLAVLRMLFKEILQDMSQKQADRLAEGYRRGENILLYRRA